MLAVNWEIDMHTEETRQFFTEQYDQAVNQCAPKYKSKLAKWRRPLWMNGKAIKTSKKKYWAWKRYVNTGRIEDYDRYCRKRNEAQQLNDKLRR